MQHRYPARHVPHLSEVLYYRVLQLHGPHPVTDLIMVMYCGMLHLPPVL